MKKIFKLKANVRPENQLSEEQSMLRSLFGHGDRVMFNVEDSECRPEIKGALTPSLIFGDELNKDNVSDSFGFGFQRKETREFFGL